MCRGRIVDSEDGGAGRQEDKREMKCSGSVEGEAEDAGQD